jgi:hypothetical protein
LQCYNILSVHIMSRPIKETPVLYGDEVRNFETRTMNSTLIRVNGWRVCFDLESVVDNV